MEFQAPPSGQWRMRAPVPRLSLSSGNALPFLAFSFQDLCDILFSYQLKLDQTFEIIVV
jgi:hypothetical protein